MSQIFRAQRLPTARLAPPFRGFLGPSYYGRILSRESPLFPLFGLETARNFHHSTSGLPKLGFKLKDLKPVEQPPGFVVGTVNDAYITPIPDYYHGSYHWWYEKMVTVALLPLTILPFAAGVPHPLADGLLSVLLLIHSKAGLESCIIDYIPKRVYPFWHKFCRRLLSFGSWVSLYGIFCLETQSEGLASLIIDCLHA